MDNSISINLNSGNNPMDSLTFYWLAEFKNDVIFQFEDGKEHKFQEVKDRINELEFFHLYHKDGMSNINFIVDLKKGFIKTLASSEPEQIEQKKNIRLIYFRRHKIDLNQSVKEIKRDIKYHLGFQYNDKNGNNRQIVLIIDELGNWILGDN
jgi:Flp pilus assembly secretin CpaC